MQTILGMCGLRRQPLRPYEVTILSAIGAALPGAAVALFHSQTQGISRVQRHSRDKDVHFYRYRAGHLYLPIEMRLANALSECHLARAQCHGAEAITVDAWMSNGIVCSLAFDSPPRRTLGQTCHIDNVEIIADLSDSAVSDIVCPTTETREPGLGAMRTLGVLSNVRRAATDVELIRFAHLWGMAVPDDYVMVLRDANGFTVMGWVVRGTNVRQVLFPDYNVVVLAEHAERGVLCVIQGSGTQTMFYYDYQMQQMVPLGNSFVSAMVFVTS